MRTVDNLSAAEQILYATSRLTFENSENRWESTGFFYKVDLPDGRNSDVLITAKHCVEGALYLTLRVRRILGEDPVHKPKIAEIRMPLYKEFVVFHKSEDLVAILIRSFLAKVELHDNKFPLIYYFGKPHIPETWEHDAFGSIIMAGNSIGQYDEHNDHVIFRSGITASHPAFPYKGRPRFLVDMAAYEGSSGSPIFSWSTFSFNRITREYELHLQPQCKLIGVLESGLEFENDHSQHHVHLGIAVQSNEIMTLSQLAEARIREVMAETIPLTAPTDYSDQWAIKWL